MKKFTLIAAAAMTAMVANAQYTCNPATSVVAAQDPITVEYLVLPDASVQDLKDAGATCTYIGADDVTRWFYIWENTMVGGDQVLGVDMVEGEPLSLTIVDPTWFGAGYNVNKGAGINLSMINENTRFHFAYMSPSNNAPTSMYLTILDGDAESDANDAPKFSDPAQVSIGTSWNSTPVIAAAFTDDWQGIDISFADLKKLCPGFSLNNMTAWTGNLFAMGGDAAQGRSFAFDTVYFYNVGEGGSNEPGDNEPGDNEPGDNEPGDNEPGDNGSGDNGAEDPDDTGIEGVAADSMFFLVTSKTINLNGGNGIVLYDLAGKTVKQTTGCVLGIDNLPKGVYVAKSGKLVKKVVVR